MSGVAVAYMAALVVVSLVVIWAAAAQRARRGPEARHARRGARPVDVAVRATPRAPDEWTEPPQDAIPTEAVRLWEVFTL